MKKTFLTLLAALLIINLSNAQVFNTGQTINQGEVSLGVSPTYYNTSSGTLGLFLYGGYGISSDFDFGIRFGVFDGKNYIGADFEKCLYNESNLAISLTGGLHGWKDAGIGLDFTANFTLQVEKIELYSGLDVDIDFMKTVDGSRDSSVKLWIPVGFNTNIMDNLELVLEADIPMKETTNAIFCGGLVFYFNR